LKRGWTRFWLCASLAWAAAVSLSAAPRQRQTPAKGGARGTNELLLAGLRPGRDTLAIAQKRFKSKKLAESEESGFKEWRDACSGRAIRVELDPKSVIQIITVTTLGLKEGACGDRPGDFLDPKNWATGQGLRVGDSQDQAFAVYGEPKSAGPTSKYGEELELLVYQFDWAGSDVPQVLEVLCARDTGRVVEMTLAAQNL
jgi:hypothetical protein